MPTARESHRVRAIRLGGHWRPFCISPQKSVCLSALDAYWPYITWILTRISPLSLYIFMYE